MLRQWGILFVMIFLQYEQDERKNLFVNFFSADTDFVSQNLTSIYFSRQNLTFDKLQILSTKVDPRAVRVE